MWFHSTLIKSVRFRDESGVIRVGKLDSDTVHAANRTYSFDELDVLSPVVPSKILASGRNYDNRFSSTDDDLPDYPPQPRIFWKGGPNVTAGHNDTIIVPDTGNVIYGGELGVVIGKHCRNISKSEAQDVIKGYTCTNDISDLTPGPFPSKFRKKSQDSFCPIGPVLATPDEVPENPRVQLFSNGELKQDSQNDEFVYSVAELISEFSKHVTLEPDDLIMMGNPGEMGPMNDGDTVEITIEGIGTLKHGVKVDQSHNVD